MMKDIFLRGIRYKKNKFKKESHRGKREKAKEGLLRKGRERKESLNKDVPLLKKI
jgi:hypothetical protein